MSVMIVLISNHSSQPLPPAPIPPMLCGRSEELTFLVQTLLNPIECHILIHGIGGMGKSCLALTALEADEIKAHFLERFFVRLDKVITGQGIVEELHRLVLSVKVLISSMYIYYPSLIAYAPIALVI